MFKKRIIYKTFIIFLLNILCIFFTVKLIYADVPKTEYSKKFIEMCEGEQWFLDEINDILMYENKSIYTVKDKYDFKNIYTLGVYDKNITGKIPTAIGELYNLEYLYLGNNKLHGDIPTQLYNLSNLKNVDLSKNNLTGQVSVNVSHLKNIEVIMLNENNISGTIPVEITTLSNLKNLDLSKNNLTGNIPVSIGSLENIHLINLSQNNLTGNIPESIGNLKNLEVLLLWDNEFSGEVPKNISNLSNIEVVDLSMNNLTGEKPSFDNDIIFGYQENQFVEVENSEEDKEIENPIEPEDDSESHNPSEQKDNDGDDTETIKNEVIEEVEIFSKKYTFNNKSPYIYGYTDSTVRPNNLITREEFASILNNVVVSDAVMDNSIDLYTDVIKNNWSYKAIQFAVSNKLMIGNDNLFRPNDNLTRAEFAKIICDLNELEIESGYSFYDANESWAKDYIYTVYKNKLMVGNNNSFRPNENITRAEAIRVINSTIDMRDINIEDTVNPFVDLKSNHWAFKEVLKASVK